MSTTAVLFSPTMLDNRRSISNTSPNVINNNNNNSNNGVLSRMQEISRRMYIAAYTETARCTWDETSSLSRHRNLSGPSSTGPRPSLDNGRALTTPPPGCTGSRGGRDGAPKERHASSGGAAKDSNHRKLDRSASEDVINGNHHHNSNERGGRGVNSSRYKTELCRPFEENGHCKYGDKCQFAHGMHELRNLARHPKYKTERCRTFHTIGFCPYGPRCHFIHNEEERVPSKRRQQQQMCALPSSAVPCDGTAALYDTKAICASPTVVSSPSLGRSRGGQSGGSSSSQSLGSSFESVATTSSTPGTMSPVLSADDKFPSITTFSASDLTPPDSCGSLTSPPCQAGAAGDTVFNFPASDASSTASLLTPLNVQTQQFNFVNNLLDLQMLYQQRGNRGNYPAVSADLNVGAGLLPEVPSSCGVSGSLWFTDNKLQEELDLLELNLNFQPSSDLFPASCSSPELLSDSMGSSSSLDEPSNAVSNPLDVGRSMRLPIFSRLT